MSKLMHAGAEQPLTVGIILLAAGASSRMGQSKQLLKINNETLLLHSIHCAVAAGSHRTVVVLGANEEAHRKVIEHAGIDIIINKDWATGIGSSIKAGLKYLVAQAPSLDAAIIMVCDQPHVTSDFLKRIIQSHIESSKSIVASKYAEVLGVPALFHKIYFSALLSLPNDRGAKKIIGQHVPDTLAIDFPEGSIDLDTMEDYQQFIK